LNILLINEKSVKARKMRMMNDLDPSENMEKSPLRLLTEVFMQEAWGYRLAF
jgi:hypothetical protein